LEIYEKACEVKTSYFHIAEMFKNLEFKSVGICRMGLPQFVWHSAPNGHLRGSKSLNFHIPVGFCMLVRGISVIFFTPVLLKTNAHYKGPQQLPKRMAGNNLAIYCRF